MIVTETLSPAVLRLRAARKVLMDFCNGLGCQALFYDIMQDGDDTLPSWATAEDRTTLDALLAEYNAAMKAPG